MSLEPRSRRTFGPSTASDRRVPLARVTFELDQHAAALLDGQIAARWANVERHDWTSGIGTLAPGLFRHFPAMLDDLDPAQTCRHLAVGSDLEDAYWWPGVDERVICADPCLFGPAGVWQGLWGAVEVGLIPLTCEAPGCGQPITGDFLALVLPAGPVTLQLVACRACVEQHAPVEALP